MKYTQTLIMACCGAAAVVAPTIQYHIKLLRLIRQAGPDRSLIKTGRLPLPLDILSKGKSFARMEK